jgi:molybdate transport system substrate-binding protein
MPKGSGDRAGMTKLEVFCARSMTHAVNKLAADFMRETGHQVDVTFGPVGTLQAKLAAGETADVLILGAPAMVTMEKQGCFVAGTRTDVSRVSIGVAVREGAPAPDISSAEAFRSALLHARAIAFTDASVGGTAAVYLPQLFKRMGIADEITRKARPQQSGAAVAECVASGEADIGITLIPEILPIKGARVIGKLPAALAGDTTYTAAVSARSGAAAEASAFIAALARPATREVWRAAGFERSEDGGQTTENK